MGNRMRLLLVTAIATLALVPAAGAAASGGGGCGGPVTEAAGTGVGIEGFCFTPTILRTGVGETVTWTNRDRVPHVVGGANMVWGSFEQLRRGDSATYRFSEPGVYPYVCAWHPGMVGAVVVGEAGPQLAGGTLDGTSVAAASENVRSPIDPKLAASTSSADPSAPWKALAAIALGLFAVTLAAGLELRRRVDRER